MATRKITFTKWLQKLVGIDTSQPVTLIHASHTRISRLSGEFLRYDTKFSGERGFFNLEGYDHIILLLFADRDGSLFSTLRPYNEGKLNYYQNSIGQPFEVVVRESLTASPHFAAIFAPPVEPA
jgi:hypothetical protein